MRLLLISLSLLASLAHAAEPRPVLLTGIGVPGKTLIPGLMHPYNETSWDDQVMKEAVEYRTLLAGKHAAATLQAGFTTLRDLGTLAIVASSSDVGGFAHGSNTRELE